MRSAIAPLCLSDRPTGRCCGFALLRNKLSVSYRDVLLEFHTVPVAALPAPLAEERDLPAQPAQEDSRHRSPCQQQASQKGKLSLLSSCGRGDHFISLQGTRERPHAEQALRCWLRKGRVELCESFLGKRGKGGNRESGIRMFSHSFASSRRPPQVFRKWHTFTEPRAALTRRLHSAAAQSLRIRHVCMPCFAWSA